MKLETGYSQSFEVRKERLFSDCKDSFSILYLSDLHLNRFSGRIVSKIMAEIALLNPAIVLLGGDYVDSKKGLFYLHALLTGISHRKNVFAIAGNHDYYGDVTTFKTIMEAHNVGWIEKESVSCNIGNSRIEISGNCIKSKRSAADFSILCLHKPIDMNKFQDVYDIAFAGHLHGCQFVFWQSGENLFPGRFFYKWNVLKKSAANCQYFISKGLGDTLPMRYNCKKDMLIIEVLSSH